MSSKGFVFVIISLVLITLTAKSQTLLNANFSQIKKEVSLKGGSLNNMKANSRYKKYAFAYPTPPEGNNSLIETTFYLVGNKCFKYDEAYWGEKLAYKRIDELKEYYPELKQIKKESKWIDKDKRFEITLVPEKEDKNNFASVYILEIKKN